MAEPRVEKFPVGGMWEEAEWKILFDYEVDLGFTGSTPCPHCHTPRRNKWGRPVVTCPRVVVATNEGGHNDTGVCLDCILEAVAGLPPSS